ncbi:hypothetical protein JCM10212_001606 [Sporobolomyces blumeae]
MPKSTTTSEKSRQPVKAPSPAPSASSRSDDDPSNLRSDSDSDSTTSDTSSRSGGRSSVSPGPSTLPPRRVDPSTQKYTPPEGFKLAKDPGHESPLDWDVINRDPELQLWAVRIPPGLKAKHLDKMVIQLPAPEIATPLQPVATFTASKSDYSAYLSNPAAAAASSSSNGKRKRAQSDKRDDDDDDDDDDDASGQTEMDGMLPLLPKKSMQNKLYRAPRPISRTLTIRRSVPATLASLPSAASFAHSTLIASQPSPVPGAILSTEDLLLDPAEIAHKKKKVARAQPSGLKFRLDLGGMKGRGGQGRYDGPGVELRDRDEILGGGRGGDGAALERGAVDATDDAEMEDGSGQAVGLGGDETKKEKKAKKDKKDKKRKDGKADAASPKKRKVKAEAE